MWNILEHRGLRLVFIANMVSMMGSGLNSAAVTWHVLQATHSEMNLAFIVVLQTIPAMLLLPFSGVVIDREDRRRLVMWLDALRGVVILGVTILAFTNRLELWHLYVMAMMVAAGFWMFWPTVTALIQELTPDAEVVHSNIFLMAGVQGGWLIAGAIVGFLYNHIGLAGILLIDFFTYVVSFFLYFFVRKGRHVVIPPAEAAAAAEVVRVDGVKGAVARFFADLAEGFRFLRAKPSILLLGVSWALFLGAMLTQSVITAPLSDRVLHAGAVGYGWLNGGWGVGAFLSAMYTAKFIKRMGSRISVRLTLGAMALFLFSAPFSRFVAVAVLLFFLMGSARGIAGVAIVSTMMEVVPKHMMGRVQNIFYFIGTFLQFGLSLAVGYAAHYHSLAAAFAIVAAIYAAASLFTMVRVPVVQAAIEAEKA
ncbi:MAG: MFS transporter [Terriglobales bacterium]